MAKRTYQFDFSLIGRGDTLAEAWGSAKATVTGVTLEQVVYDLADMECPEKDFHRLTFHSDLKFSKGSLWWCEHCKKVWLVTDDGADYVGELSNG